MRSRTKYSEEEQSEYKKEKIFLIFKWNVLHDDSLRAELKNEMNSFAKVLLSKFQKADSNSTELEAQKYHNFFFKLIEYSHKYCNIKNIEDTKLLVEFLSHFIDLTSS